jgi:predicted CopG family antitoxin
MELKHITISAENYNALKDLGKAGDSFNDVVTKVLGKINALPKIVEATT